MLRQSLLGCLCALGFALGTQASAAECGPGEDDTSPPKIILDTDFGGDADDLGAIGMLHHYADRGMVDLLAIASWSNEQYAMPALAAVNTFYGRPSLAMGVRDTESWRTEWNYTKPIADSFSYDPDAIRDLPTAVSLYRKLLAAASDHEVTIVTVGPLANIRDLIASPPDGYSDLSGAELIDRKVRCFVVMGGQFPEGQTDNGAEWNFDGNMPGVTQYVLDRIKRPIVFSGFEVGEVLKVGVELNTHPADTPLHVGYLHFSEHAPWIKAQYNGAILDNSSFDQTAVMFAVLKDSNRFWSLSSRGVVSADAKGNATWNETPDGNHRYLILDGDRQAAEAEILTAMTHIPE